MARRRKPRKIRFTAPTKRRPCPTPVRCVAIIDGDRTRQCFYRTTLAKQPAEYKRPPKCPKCGTPFTYIDRTRIKKDWKNRKNVCNCGAYAFPHYRGRGYCEHNPNLTAEDLRLREEGGPRREPGEIVVPF